MKNITKTTIRRAQSHMSALERALPDSMHIEALYDYDTGEVTYHELFGDSYLKPQPGSVNIMSRDAMCQHYPGYDPEKQYADDLNTEMGVI